MFGSGLQLPLPDTVTERCYHSLSATQLSSHNVLLVTFGGQRSFIGAKLSDTVLIELSEYVLQYSSYSDRHCSVVLVYCRHTLSMQSREMVSGWWGG